MSTAAAMGTSNPWPEWMLRFIASGDDQAFWDLIWSVGGSPPYGGVSYDEATAVYNFLDGPDRASPAKYEALKKIIASNPDRLSVLEIYRLHDRITDEPDSFAATDVEAGHALAEKLNHDGVRGLFLCYGCDLANRNGDLPKARDLTVEALRIFLKLADQDPVYAFRAAQTAQNTVSLTALCGDEEAARKLHEQLKPVLEGFDFNE